MISISRQTLTSYVCVLIFVCLTVATPPVEAQSQPNGLPFEPSSETLGKVLEHSAEKVLSTCKSWPPRLAKKESDQNKRASDKALENKSVEITAQLANDLSIKPDEKPYVYDASVLRMLDSVGNFNPLVPDSQQLGIALHVEPSQLQLWGTSASIVKYDCLSMLSLAAKAGGGFWVPFFSLKAAFEASQSTSSNQTSTFFFGSLQSPFDYMYDSTDQPLRLFAGLKAMEWRINNNGDPSSRENRYVATAHFLTIEKGATASDKTSLLGNMKAGAALPFVSLSSEIAGQYTTSLQANSISYKTYFWSPVMKTMADLSTLSADVANNLPQLVPNVYELTPGTTVTATASVSGWPKELCTSGKWKLTTRNQNFSAPELDMTGTTTNAWPPTCTIKTNFSFRGAPAQGSSDLSPQLYLENTTNNNVSIPLSVSGTFHSAGSTSAAIQPGRANWDLEESDLFWTIVGDLEIPKGRVITLKEIRTAEFSCKTGDGSTLPIEKVELEGGKEPMHLSREGSDPNFKIFASLSLKGTTKYDTDPSQANIKTCTINGVLRVSTTNSSGANPLSESVKLQTPEIYYPNKLTVPSTTTVPAAPANVTATTGIGQVSLTWAASANAATYNIYRGTAQNKEEALKSGVQGTSYVDTSVVGGTTYYYQITAVNSVGEGKRSNEASAVPH